MSNSVFHSRRYIAIIIALAIALVIMFCSRERKRFWTDEGIIWTTEYHITYESNRQLTDSITSILTAIDNSVSPYNKESLITRINNNTTQEADSLFCKLYNVSLAINSGSQGSFDPTVMPLVNAWGFGYKTGSLPSQRQIDSLLTFVGITKTHLKGKTIIKEDPRIQFDFSSIAKGFACDEIGRMLKRNGASNFVIEIGGEVVAYGVNSRGETWHVSVDLPKDEDSAVSHQPTLILGLSKRAVATSGNYRKFKIVDGKKVSHIIDPKTGLSSQSNLLSATIVAPDCMTADAWATACMVMGTERVKQLSDTHQDLGIMTITADSLGNYVVWANETFTKLVIQVPSQ